MIYMAGKRHCTRSKDLKFGLPFDCSHRLLGKKSRVGMYLSLLSPRTRYSLLLVLQGVSDEAGPLRY